MLALLLVTLLAAVPADSSDDLDACLSQAPVQSELRISWGKNEMILQMWSSDPPVSRDTVRAHLSQVRTVRECFLSLDPSGIKRPYLDNFIRTFYQEAAFLAALRRFSDAFEVFEQARSFLASDPPIPSTEATQAKWPHILHRNQGLLCYYLGDLSSAIDHYLMALRETPSEAIDSRVTYLLDVGILHQRTQDYRSTRHYFDHAERLFRESKLLPDTHSSLWVRVLSRKADLLLEETLNTTYKREPLEQARDLARRGRAAAEPKSEEHADVTRILSETLGYLEHFERAYQLNKEARQYARANEDSRRRAFSLLKLGVLHIQTGRWTQAESALNTSLAMAKAFGDLDYQRRIFRALGRLHELQSDWVVAEDYYRQGVAVIEKYRESLTATQWSSTAFAQWRDVHRGLVRTLLAQDQPRKALAALDRTRARHLQDLRTQARVVNQLPATARTRLDSLSGALTDVRTRLGKGALSDAEEADLRTREATLMSARQQILQLDSAVSTRPSIDEISKALARQDRALVSYFLDNPWPVYDRSPRSAAFVLTADTLRTVSLSGLTQDSVQAQVRSISPVFTQSGNPQHINALHFDLRPLRILHDRLYSPIAEHLSPSQPLTVIPDGQMFHVPFSLLATATPGGRHDHTKARFVLHQRPTTLDLAASMVADTSETTFGADTFAPTLAAFGVSKFDTLRTIPSALRTTFSGTAADSTLQLPSLPGVQAEIEALDRAVGDAETFLDEAATESAFASACRRAGVVHLASHAFVHPSFPLQNSFLLRPDSTSDGLLFLHELQDQDRVLPLAVLSGCSTARGTLRGGEGMEGLQYAFRAMGAQSTVANLWSTADRPSVALMENFYRNLRSGLPKDQALQQAKLTYLKNHPNKASPFFWAPSVLYGSPDPVPMDPPNETAPWPWWLPILVGSVVLGGILLWRFIRLPGWAERVSVS